jgi:hypothetical protein
LEAFAAPVVVEVIPFGIVQAYDVGDPLEQLVTWMFDVAADPDWIEAGFAFAEQLNTVVPLGVQLIVMLPFVATLSCVVPDVQLVVVELTVTVCAKLAGLAASHARAARAGRRPRLKNWSRFI